MRRVLPNLTQEDLKGKSALGPVGHRRMLLESYRSAARRYGRKTSPALTRAAMRSAANVSPEDRAERAAKFTVMFLRTWSASTALSAGRMEPRRTCVKVISSLSEVRRRGTVGRFGGFRCKVTWATGPLGVFRLSSGPMKGRRREEPFVRGWNWSLKVSDLKGPTQPFRRRSVGIATGLW